jgi:flagellar motor switch protein FliN/FliY
MDRQILSQEEINALLQDMDSDRSPAPKLTSDQKDALGEIGNISYGSASTALSQLLNKRVEINTPTVFLTTPRETKEQHPCPYVLLKVEYKEGLKGTNILILKVEDAAVIANLFMGGDGQTTKTELDEIELSAVTEAMNQMAGNAATSLSSLFSQKIDICPPQMRIIDFGKDSKTLIHEVNDDDYMAAVQFRLVIEDLVDSEIVLMFPFEFAVKLVDSLLDQTLTPATSSAPSPSPIAENRMPEPLPLPESQPARTEEPPRVNIPPMAAGPVPAPGYVPPPQQHVMVQPAQFANLGGTQPPKDMGNIGLILDVPLQVTVELGNTRMKIKEILELGLGSVIELDKLAGDPVDIFVNGKLIAKGEVVVIDENFGIKVTDIVSHIERVNTLQ